MCKDGIPFSEKTSLAELRRLKIIEKIKKDLTEWGIPFDAKANDREIQKIHYYESLKNKLKNWDVELHNNPSFDEVKKKYLNEKYKRELISWNIALTGYENSKTIEERYLNEKKERKKLPKIKPKIVQKVLDSLYESRIIWKCAEYSDNWLILIEPISQKRVKIQIDTIGYGTNSIYIDKLPDTLRLLAKKWNEPFNPKKLNEGTLTNCGWHAHLPDDKRRSALNMAISIYGRERILKALNMSKKSPWLSDYEKVLENDIAFASKGKSHLPRYKQYDRQIYVMMI